jgi:spore germination protein GerM
VSARRALVIAALISFAVVAVGSAIVLGWPRWSRRASAGSPAATTAPLTTPAPPGRKIKAHLFYVSDDGLRLTGVERDVTYGDSAVEQAREILAAQIAPVAEPLVSAIPTGTKLRAVFIGENGDAYVDLSKDVSSAHSGGTLDELLTVYTIVHALTENLPAVTAVQVIVDGKEVETLAGHIDLRRPLAKNLAWVQ